MLPKRKPVVAVSKDTFYTAVAANEVLIRL
jgi:hypothetical protein